MKNLKLHCLNIIFVSLITIIIFSNSASIAIQWTITDAINAVNNRDIKAITFLINDTTADPHLADFRNHIILIMATDSGQKNIVQLLLESDNIHLKDRDLHLALTLAVYNGYKEIVQLLIDHKIDINIQDKYDDKKTALMIAVEEEQEEEVQLLIDSGANIDLQNAYGQTALMIAVEKGYKNIAKLLIDSGANIDLKNVYGHDVVMIAFLKNHTRPAIRFAYPLNSTNTKNQDNRPKNSTIYNQLLSIRTNPQSCAKFLLESM